MPPTKKLPPAVERVLNELARARMEKPTTFLGRELKPRTWRWLKGGLIAVGSIVLLALLGDRLVSRNLAVNPGFELGTDSWGISFGRDPLTVASNGQHSGRQAIASRKRLAHYVGPEQSLLGRLRPGQTYVCSGWVKIENSDEEPVKLTIRQRDANGLRYHHIGTNNVSSNTWCFLSGRFEFQPSGPLQTLALYFEGPRRGVDLLVDDVRIVPDRFTRLVWPGGSALGLLGAGALLGLVTRRERWLRRCGMGATVLALGLLASWYFDHYSAIVASRPPDYARLFKSLGFEKVERGSLLEVKYEIQEPTVFEGRGVRIHGNCTTNLAIVANIAEIYGRVSGKVYFRGGKITVMPGALVEGGLDSSGQVVQRGTIRAPLSEPVSVNPSDSEAAVLALTNSRVFAEPIGGSVAGGGLLEWVGTTTSEDLGGVVDLTISADGRFLYAAAFHGSTLSVYRRDGGSGQLHPVQCLRKGEGMNGVISIRLSPDQRYAVTAAMRSEAVALFQRNPGTGELELLHVARRREGFPGLTFAVRAAFAPDGTHVYALSGGTEGGVTALRLTPEGRLEWLQALADPSTRGGSRALSLLPDGRTIVAVNYRSHMLTVLARDPDTGGVSVRQRLGQGEGGVDGLDGPFGVTSSPDGKFVYVCSGRFTGDDGVSVFQVRDGNLVLAQSLLNGHEGLVFVGGNEVVVAPDGLNVYATATRSGTLACFARDPQTGKLRLRQAFKSDNPSAGPAGLTCSPDGRFVYVPLEAAKGISIYRRELAPTVAARPSS